MRSVDAAGAAAAAAAIVRFVAAADIRWWYRCAADAQAADLAARFDIDDDDSWLLIMKVMMVCGKF